ncbi:DUF4326 domain-containing protein [Streptomyces bobili]|uniref:DUF4326 domain-containing protein n=1 Tax=Streptomyces bobili TaxID=67280 RepID=UPI002254EB6D|nr:DUF4326 domain-containing protein [Streptomyces bobili]MCX5522633.1 DUF4326 domain-containing protein [Streptomyces bobili]
MTSNNTRPRRIQRQRTKGWRKPEGAVYVGRGSRWGNPFTLAPAASQRGGLLDMWAVEHKGRRLGRWDDSAGARADAADRYARWIREPEQAALVEAAHTELAGLDLMCWCPEDEPCHADVLLALVAEAEASTPV